MTEKTVSYQTTNSYTTLNNFSHNTKTVWVVFHGIGYLSRYFLRYFKDLDPEENYIIAPQAPSKYYLKNEYKHVGASWLTKEETQRETENLLHYLDKVFDSENLVNAPRLFVVGYSQGVSIASRWVARKKIQCSKLILMSGKIPAELEAEDFSFLKNNKTILVYGTNDAFFSTEVFTQEKNRAMKIFGNQLQVIPFEGGHEVKKEMLPNFL